MRTRSLTRVAAICCCAALLLPLLSAVAQPRHAPLVIGVVLPENDGALRGAQLGSEEAARTASLMGLPFAVHVAHADGSAAAAAARSLLAEHSLHVLVGGADAASASALMDAAAENRVLFLNVAARDDSLRARCAPLTFHIAPAQSYLAAAAATRGDSAVAWHDTLERFGAGQVNDRYRAKFGGTVTEREWAGWLAVKIAWEAAQRAPSPDAMAIAAYLTAENTIFDGHKGLPLSFRRGTHQLRQPVYVLSGDSVAAEVPAPRDEPDIDPAELLDRLATGEPTCSAR